MSEDLIVQDRNEPTIVTLPVATDSMFEMVIHSKKDQVIIVRQPPLPSFRKVENQWISVKDRLPESLEKGRLDIIVASYSFERKKWHIQAAEFQRGNFYDRYNERMPIDDAYWPITHWMPLPEPPEKE